MKLNRLIPMLSMKSMPASVEFYTFYGMTEFRIDDPDGNRLWIGQNVLQEEG